MLGLFVGTVCLVGLVATVRRRRFAGFYGGGPACGYSRWDDDAPRSGQQARSWPSRRGVLRGLFVRLDTTPGQEKAIVAIVEQTAARVRASRGELVETRKQVAALLAGEPLDRATLAAHLAGPTRTLEGAADALTDVIAQVHELLDQHQRQTLSELVADGSLGRVLARGASRRW